VGTAHSHLEEKSTAENRQRALRGGAITYIKDTSSSSEKSAEGTAPLAVEVGINESNGTYEVKPEEPGDGRPSTARNVIGKSRWSQCYRDDCKSGESDIYSSGIPWPPPLDPLGGKLKDRNHIQGSIMLRKDNIGRAKNGVFIQSMTVDLWRSGSN
jgi:hypothetical protein